MDEHAHHQHELRKEPRRLRTVEPRATAQLVPRAQRLDRAVDAIRPELAARRLIRRKPHVVLA